MHSVVNDVLESEETQYAKIREEAQLLLDGEFIGKATEMVRNARKSVWICAYTWRWYENAPEKDIQRFNYEVARKAKARRDVRGLMHMRSEAMRLRDYGLQTKVLPTDRTMHTKAILVDGERLILGSHNLTERGTAENYEASLLITECQAVTLFENYFERMWNNYAEN